MAADLLAQSPEVMDFPDLHLDLVPESSAGRIHLGDWGIAD